MRHTTRSIGLLHPKAMVASCCEAELIYAALLGAPRLPADARTHTSPGVAASCTTAHWQRRRNDAGLSTVRACTESHRGCERQPGWSRALTTGGGRPLCQGGALVLLLTRVRASRCGCTCCDLVVAAGLRIVLRRRCSRLTCETKERGMVRSWTGSEEERRQEPQVGGA